MRFGDAQQVLKFRVFTRAPLCSAAAEILRCFESAATISGLHAAAAPLSPGGGRPEIVELRRAQCVSALDLRLSPRQLGLTAETHLELHVLPARS